MISNVLSTLGVDERFVHYNFCDFPIKVACLGWRATTIYTKRRNMCFPPSSVSIYSLVHRASAYQRMSQSEPLGKVSTARSSWEPSSHTTGQALCKSQQLAVGHAFPELASSFPLSPTIFYLNHTLVSSSDTHLLPGVY